MHKNGFTLIEVLVTLGLLVILAAVLAAASPGLYRGYGAHDVRDTLVAALMHARSQAMNGVCTGSVCTGAPAHGVHIDEMHGRLHDVVLFQGTAYDANDPLNASVFTGSISQTVFYSGPAEVIFAPLSGDAAPATMLLWGGSATSTITVGAEGQINIF